MKMYEEVKQLGRDEAIADLRKAQIYLNTAELSSDKDAANLAYEGMCLIEKAAMELGFSCMAELMKSMSQSRTYKVQSV